jgi:hypothetical protein
MIFSLVLGMSIFLVETAWAQEPATANGVPVHLLVTAEPRHGSDVPTINREDVRVMEGHDRDKVTDWIPAVGERAALELVLLLDDGSSSSGLGPQLEDLRKFINAQPATTEIGVAYMRDGVAMIEQNPTDDHAQAAKKLRLPLGESGGNASPYFALSDLIKRWPATAARREVLMVTDGIDRYYGSGDLQDPYLQSAIDDAARAGVIVSAIYNPGAGHFGHSRYQTYWGQNYLAELAEKTGGEAYYIGFDGPAVSFTPFLDDVERRLGHQYFVIFLAKAPKKSGWQQVRLSTEVPNVDLVSAGRVWVSGER